MQEKDAIYEDKTFDKLNYQDKLISDCTFTNCTFTHCNFCQTIFKNCRFEECTFDKCDLSMMKVKGSTFSHINIADCKAIGILWFDAKTPFARKPFTISFIDSFISYSSFYGMNLRKVKFSRCTAKEVDFSECDLTEATLHGADLEGTRFINCDLSGADLTDARNYYIDVQANKIKKAKFSMPEAMALLDSLDIILD